MEAPQYPDAPEVQRAAEPPMPPRDPSMSGPLRESQRIAALDLLRGLALFGIFMVNMQFFAMPFGEYLDPQGLDGEHVGDLVSWAFVKALFEYKFISLFSLLFGAGLIVQMTRAERSGRRFFPLYLRRLLILALFGLVHGFLFWYGDILFLYACIGFWLLLMRKLRPKTMLIVATCLILFLAALSGLAGVAGVVFSDYFEQAAREMEQPSSTEPAANETDEPERESSPDPAEQAPANADAPEDDDNGGWADNIPWLKAMSDAQFDPTADPWLAAEVEAYKHGPFTDALGFRGVTFLFAWLAAIFGYGWHVLAMFLVGAAFMKLNVFSPTGWRWHKWLLWLGLLAGLPLELAGAWLQHWSFAQDHWPSAMFANGMHEIGSAFMCLGIVGAGCLLSSVNTFGRLTHPFRCVGRMSLTNYFAQTLMTTALMYHWGLGWFNDVSRPMQISLVVAIYCGQLLFSTLWMRFFTIGPVEWLWRSLTYLRIQPLLRSKMEPLTAEQP